MKIHIYPKSMLETVWQQDKLLFTPEAEQPPLCLRCGQPLDHRLVINALSRYADVHICEACGMDEALRDANRCPLPLTEWAAVKNGLSQQQTDFEAPLLTTSCTFEDLFQQGSRPASEIAYSRSDYDGWKWWTTWHQCQKSAPILEAAHEIDAFQNALFQLPEFRNLDTLTRFCRGYAQPTSEPTEFNLYSETAHFYIWLRLIKLLILDEPFVGLDPEAFVILKEQMKELCASGNSVLFSSHILDVVEKVCNKVSVIKHGQLLYSGRTTEIVGTKGLEEVFMEMNGDEISVTPTKE